MRLAHVLIVTLVLISCKVILGNEYFQQADYQPGHNGHLGGYYDNGWNYGYQDPHSVRRNSGYRNEQYDRYGNQIYPDNRLWRPNGQGPQWGGAFPMPYQESPKRNELYYDNLGSRKHDRSLLENLNNYPVKKN
ncbi:hypothetical protein PPYR_06724 [Photinus pyralis]|uniref:Uncharacterized protein n=1 Tax=Photinus pyralis TaxID=7054 RepID=A0A1Y1NH40_PHOPY|nr:hypothetical protein PPYR_06724 [Photinus pyralis]